MDLMKYILSVWLMMTVLVLSGQQDSISIKSTLGEILIQDAPVPTTSLKLSSDLTFGEHLTRQSSTYVRSYGKGSLATLSLRGGTSQQTQLLWDGIPIQNPMLGLADLSLVSSALFSKAILHSGGQSTQYGSGAICGAIDIKNMASETKGGQAGIAMGSFGSRTYNLGYQWLIKKWRLTMSSAYEVADNDFTYLVGGNERTQPNAQFDSKGLLLSAGYQLKNGALKLSYWLQDIHRGIPPTTVQNRSEATQDDHTQRVRLDLKKSIGKGKVSSALAYMDEDNNYDDPPSLIAARNNFKRWLSTTTVTRSYSRTQLLAKLDLNHTNGNTAAYDASQNTFQQAALYTSLHQDFNFVDIKIGLRTEWNNLTSPPLLPSLTINHQRGAQSIRLKLSKEYRVPGLNDLFWRPGGNPDLRPEKGWNQELTVAHKSKHFVLDATLYHRKLEDWILWLPSTETGFVSAINIAEVRSRGLEVNSQLSGQVDKINWQWSTQYHYGRSTHLQAIPGQRIDAGDQLIYTPQHTLSSGWTLHRDQFSLQIDNRYTSAVSGINEDVDGYFLLDMQLNHSKKYKLNKTALTGIFSLSVNNILDYEYRIVERRPMPGRNYTLSFNIKF